MGCDRTYKVATEFAHNDQLFSPESLPLCDSMGQEVAETDWQPCKRNEEKPGHSYAYVRATSKQTYLCHGKQVEQREKKNGS